MQRSSIGCRKAQQKRRQLWPSFHFISETEAAGEKDRQLLLANDKIGAQADRHTGAQMLKPVCIAVRQTDRQAKTIVLPSADGVGVNDLTLCILQEQAEAAMQHSRGSFRDGGCMLV